MSTTDLSTLTRETIGGLEIFSPESPRTYNFLIYGEPGVGKTVFAGSACEVEGFGPVLFLDVEGGTFSLMNTYPNCKVIRLKSWGDIQKVYGELYDRKGMGGQFNTVVLDSLSEIGKFCMTQIMMDVKRQDPSRDLEVPSVREWGILLERMRMVCRGFRDLEHVNSILTCHLKIDKDDRNGTQKGYPSLNGQLTREAPGFFDFVFYMYNTTKTDRKSGDVQTERLLMTSPTEKYTAKDRSGRLPQLVEEPTMAKVMQYILGGS